MDEGINPLVEAGLISAQEAIPPAAGNATDGGVRSRNFPGSSVIHRYGQ